MYTVRRVARQILADRINDAEAAHTDSQAKRDIISLLVRARKEGQEKGEEPLSDEDMVAQILTFLAAGHETTAAAMAWVRYHNFGIRVVLIYRIQTLWLLANDKASQDRAREEVQRLYETSSRPDYRSIKDLQWLECVVCVVPFSSFCGIN